MSENVIKNTDLFSSDLTKKAIKQLKEFDSALSETEKGIKNFAEKAQKDFKSLDLSKIKDIEKLELLLKQTAKAEEELNDVQKTKAKTQKKIIELTAKEIKQNEVNAKRKAEKKKALKLEIDLENALGHAIDDVNDLVKIGTALAEKENKTKAELAETNRLLSQITSKLNLNREEEVEALKKFNTVIDENNELIKDNSKEQKELNDVQKTKDKTQKKIIELTAEEIKQNEVNAKRKAEKKKALKLEIDLENALGHAIDDVNDLVKIGTALAEKENKTKAELAETNRLLSQITSKLNLNREEEVEALKKFNTVIDENNELIKDNSSKAQQAKINVGNYTESINEAIGSFDIFGGKFDKITKGFSLVSKALKKNTKEVKENTKEQKELSDALKKTGQSADEAKSKWQKFSDAVEKGGVIGVLLGALASLVSYFQEGGEGAEDFAQIMARIDAVIGSLTSTLASMGKVLFAIGEDLANGNFLFEKTRKAVSDAGKAISDTKTRIEEATKANLEYLEVQKRINKQIADYLPLLAKLQAQEQILIDLVDDDKISLTTRNILKGVSIAKTKEYFSALVDEAKIKKELLEFEIKKTVADKAGTAEIIKRAGSIEEAVKDAKIRSLIGIDKYTAYMEAIASVVTAEQEFVAKRRDNAEKIKMLERDIFERDLDDLIDFTDKQVIIQEKLTATTSANLEVRKQAIEEIGKLQEESFKKQFDAVEKQRKNELKYSIESVKLALSQTDDATLRVKLLNDINEKQKQLNTTIDTQRLIQAKTSEEFNAYLRSLGLSEITETRVLQAIRDKIDQQQSYNDAVKEGINIQRQTSDLINTIALQEEQLGVTQTERVTKTFMSLAELESYQKELSAKTIDFAQKETDAKIKALEEEIKTRKEAGETNSVDLLTAEKDLNDLLIAENERKNSEIEKQNEKYFEDEKKRLEEEAEAEKEILQDIADFADQIFKEVSEKAEERTQKKLDDVRKAQELLQTQIENGNQQAVKSLTNLSKQEAKILEQQEKQQKRKQQAEFLIAGFKSYASNSEKDPATALTKTLADSAVLVSSLKAIGAFYEGTENVRKSLGAPNLRTEKDNYLIRVDGNERILNGKQNAIIPSNFSNDMVVDAVRSKLKGEQKSVFISDNSDVIAEIKALNKSLQKQKTDIDLIKGVVEMTTIEHGKTTKRLKKWGNI